MSRTVRQTPYLGTHKLTISTVFSSGDPINTGGGSWSASKDFASETYWQSAVGGNLSSNNIFSAGVYFGTGSFNIPDLIKNVGDSAEYVKDYCSHNYPQGGGTYNLAALMSHSSISSQIAQYSNQISAASAAGKPHIMGETNSGIFLPLTSLSTPFSCTNPPKSNARRRRHQPHIRRGPLGNGLFSPTPAPRYQSSLLSPRYDR